MTDNMIEPLQMRQLFGVPVFRKKFEMHSAFKEQILEYFKDKENFRKTSTRQSLLFTSANLHREELFKPYTDFFVDSLKEVMTNIGFVPDIALTGMWGTVHPDGGFHHRHTHFNSFLAGVYYFDGTPQCSGTTFFNPLAYHNQIVPRFNDDRPLRSLNEYTAPFEEGVLIIFPAWLSHMTAYNNLNRTSAYRKILSFNSMPVGATNCDTFDRYYYPDVSNNDLLPVNANDVINGQNRVDWSLVDREPYFKQFEIKEEGH